MGFSNSSSAGRTARLKASRDPYFLNRDYSELNELENGTNNAFVDFKGTNTTVESKGTTTADNGGVPAPVSEHDLEDLKGDPNTRVIVSRSVQVESRPCGIED